MRRASSASKPAPPLNAPAVPAMRMTFARALASSFAARSTFVTMAVRPSGSTLSMYIRVLTTITPSGHRRRHSSSPTVSGDGLMRPSRARQPYMRLLDDADHASGRRFAVPLGRQRADLHLRWQLVQVD